MHKDRGWERDYKIPSGQIITLKLEEDFSEITFWENGKQLGNNMNFEFKILDESDNSYLLSRMYVPIKRVGLGRAALESFKYITRSLIYCRSHDGIVRDDGSHLTEDAPAFVTKMINEGLIESNDSDYYIR